ncbi:26S proteasome non-ATPase regulatory subunit [Canna indica]|uniref:26S proteasome non-ATPase regulatory subunit n=1 Tax=Canna indica TaxID=4628 RepID=A0AAQ3JRJ0_9LILI|nr:26S proteasome non-ATPase regulatory subunit [Canna indica]
MAKQATMDPQLVEVTQLFERFKAAIMRNDLDTCTNLLSQLKVRLTKFPSLPPSFQETPNAVQELTIARDIYEHAVVFSVKTEDQDAFERDFFQLKPYYTDTSGIIPPSAQEYPILGLNLLRLLVQNRIAEFHTELELLPQSALENPCIKHAVELEQSFMEGAYNRVLSARQTVPHDTYVYFMDLLAKTVRDEIAGCSEKAYDYLTVNDAKKILMFSSQQQLSEYISEEHPEWEIKNDCVFFQKAKESQPCKEIPALQLINQTLSYARELERIAGALVSLTTAPEDCNNSYLVELQPKKLVIKGGQNLLILVHKLGHYIQLGTTIDDTIGEAYDKTVRWLGLDMGKGSGPALEEHALEGDPSSINFSVSFLKYSQILMNHESNTLKGQACSVSHFTWTRSLESDATARVLQDNKEGLQFLKTTIAKIYMQREKEEEMRRT